MGVGHIFALLMRKENCRMSLLMFGLIFNLQRQAGRDPERLRLGHEVTPYLLIQMALAYEQNPDLGNYSAFVVRMRGPNELLL